MSVWIEALLVIFEVFYESTPLAIFSVSLFYDLISCGVITWQSMTQQALCAMKLYDVNFSLKCPMSQLTGS